MLKKRIVTLFVLTLLVIFCHGCNNSGRNTTPGNDSSENDIVDEPGDNEDIPPESTWLYTSGNHIYKSDGTVFMGRGANLQDSRGCNACAYNEPNVDEVKRRIDVLVDTWKADFIRLTLESYEEANYRNHFQGVLDDEEYLTDIIEIIDYIGTKPGVYVLLSLWVDPSFDNMGWPTADTITVWEKIAETFYDKPYVMFGLVNEPEYNFDGGYDDDVWQAMNSAVAAIRSTENSLNGKHHIITVQGTGGWSRFIEYYVGHPITAGNGENIAYETHVYNPQSDFESLFINPSSSIPVIIGEFGPTTYMNEDDCQALMNSAENLSVPYLAWTFHQRCAPNLIMDYSNNGCGVDMDIVPTEWGELLKNQLAK